MLTINQYWFIINLSKERRIWEMTFTVWYTKIFDEEYEGADIKEFNNLKDAWNYYSSIKDTDRNAQLWAGKSRIH